jgi:hypothetical protein
MNTLPVPPPPDTVMVKAASLVSLTAELAASLTRTFAALVALFGTVHV